jgi:flagellar motor switch protein FliN/FliY
METKESKEPGIRKMDLLLDVPLEVAIELGRTRMPIKTLLELGPGSVVELDKVAGEPLDILVNGRLIARGEAVVVNDKFGIRLTDIVSRSERIARLR